MPPYVALLVVPAVWALMWRVYKMATLSKRKRAISELLTPGKVYTRSEAIELLKKMPKAKFR